MVENWKTQSDHFLVLAHHISTTDLILKYKKSILDRCLRSASDIISSESLSVHNNTMSMLQWCKYWSVQAIQTYDIVAEQLTLQRNGKLPTHRQICNAKDESNTRYWTVEHQHPLIIAKEGLLTHNWSLEELKDWMYAYGRATIVTQAENRQLKSFTKDMNEAQLRYTQANIEITVHPHFKENQ